MSVAMSKMLSPAPIVTRILSPHDTSPKSRLAMTFIIGLSIHMCEQGVAVRTNTSSVANKRGDQNSLFARSSRSLSHLNHAFFLSISRSALNFSTHSSIPASTVKLIAIAKASAAPIALPSRGLTEQSFD